MWAPLFVSRLKFAVDGTVLDMASEPNSERKQQSFKHKAYPVRESGGFVWVYLGDEATMTDFQPPAWAPAPNISVSVVKIHTPCNWAQVLEGSIDSAHSSSLHSTMPTAEVAGPPQRRTPGSVRPAINHPTRDRDDGLWVPLCGVARAHC